MLCSKLVLGDVTNNLAFQSLGQRLKTGLSVIIVGMKRTNTSQKAKNDDCDEVDDYVRIMV